MKLIFNLLFALLVIYCTLFAISYYTGAAFRTCVVSPSSEILKLCYQSSIKTDATVPYLTFSLAGDK